MSRQGTQTALAPWFGSKRSLAAAILAEIGPHRSYWEPFCGGMAVLLSKPVCPIETVNDLHGDLVNLARVVRDEDLARRLDWRLRRTLASEALFREALAALGSAPRPTIDAPPDPDRAYHYFVCSWLGMNGIAGTQRTGSSFCRRYTSKGGDPAGRFAAAVDSLPWWHERLRSVLILSSCGIGLCERIEDRAGAVVFADPPYLLKSAKYAHDFATADHERLAAALCRFKATRCVVSYYEHPDLDRLYPGWRRVNVGLPKRLTAPSRRGQPGRIDAPEVLLINGPAFDQAAKPEGLFQE